VRDLLPQITEDLQSSIEIGHPEIGDHRNRGMSQ
jgi:hypothetical protein